MNILWANFLKWVSLNTLKLIRTPEILQKAPHRLIDILDPAESYSVADFCVDAKKHMDEITAQGKIPLLVGGTMMYFKALKDGLSELPKADEILLFGPAQMKFKLEKIITETPELALKLKATNTSGNMTHNQKLAYVRDFYKPSWL